MTDIEIIKAMLERNQIQYAEKRAGCEQILVDGAFDNYTTFNFNPDGSLRFIGSGKHREDGK